MATPVTSPDFGSAPAQSAGVDEVARMTVKLWWLWLVTGIAWLGIAFVVLQFDQASVKTIGYIVGCMFIFAGVQNLAVAMIAPSLRVLWAIFGVVFLVAGAVCFLNPEDTFVGLADVLGFLLFFVGVWWVIRAFVERAAGAGIWWLGLLSGVLMMILAFWTSGQFFIEKAYTLLVFAGIWALMHGITDIVRAFVVRGLRDDV